MSKSTRTSLALAASFVAMTGAASHGVNIVYENTAGIDFNYQWLDITRPVSMQTGVQNAYSVYPRAEVYETEFGPAADVAVDLAPGMRTVEVEDLEITFFIDYYTHYFDASDEVGPDTVADLQDTVEPVDDFRTFSWGGGPDHFQYRYGIGEIEFVQRLPFSADYLGLQFQRHGETHYGWIEYEADGNHSFSGGVPAEDVFAEINVLSWGWQTTPGEPVTVGEGIPAPGAVSIFAVAGLAGIRRRR